MTFCCRPSPNCQRCRERRLKCDRVKPACSQCKRAHKECSGYREESSLLFRDENERIIRRSKAAHERSQVKAHAIVRKQAPNARLEVVKLSGTNAQPHALVWPMPGIYLDVDAHGLQFFFRHFSNKPWADGDSSGGKSQDLLRDIDTNTSLRNAVVSVGLGALSNVNGDRKLLSLARQRYGATLRAVRNVVKDPSCGNVGTLMKMIVMLAIFEMVDARPDASTCWTIHLTGIAALLKQSAFPPRLEFNTQAELWFYLAAIVDYFQVGGSFPDALESWQIQRTPLLMGEAQAAFELIDILIEFVRLCSCRRQLYAEEVLCKAVQLEIELQAWMERLPARWSFEVEETTDRVGTFYGQHHVYRDVWAPRVLSHYQLGRLLVNEVIVAYASQLGEIKRTGHSLAVINQMATDICIGTATQDLSGEPCSLPHGDIPRPLLKGVFMTIYPLTLAGSATGVSDKLRNWVIGTLQQMGDHNGIRQAFKAIRRIQWTATMSGYGRTNGVSLAFECPSVQGPGLAAARIRV
ncbi:Zn(II)2Cys6 transcription factor domain-containing protein [Aspergillus undulatus]|uniref:Zn(II)2Cys6 transcription factor domain-containing protein n=1 Tax=Aspergillus undulatus TaxID=1810928 RepID=UPI003CCDF590